MDGVAPPNVEHSAEVSTVSPGRGPGRRVGPTLELFRILTARELSLRYRRTVLGWFWSALNPLLMTAIYGVVFGALFKVSVPPGKVSGISGFSYYLLSGLLPWNLLTTALGGSTLTIIGNAHLVKRVRFRNEILVVSNVAALSVSLFIEIAVLISMIFLTEHVISITTVVGTVVLVILLGTFVLGLALAISALSVFLRDLQYLVTIGLTAWLYLSAVMYPISLVPKQATFAGVSVPLQTIVRHNPMTDFIGAFRSTLYDGVFPSGQLVLRLIVLASVSVLVGSQIFRRLSGGFTNVL